VIGAITAGFFSTPTPPVTSSYESIATVTLGSANSTISFTSIPSTYKHLQLRYIGGTTDSSQVKMVFNSDTAANYSQHRVYGTGSGTGATGWATGTYNYAALATVSGFSNVSNIFTAGVTDILDYTSASKNKTVRNLIGLDVNGAGGSVEFSSNAWYNSGSAISSITFTTASGSNFTTNTQIALYGIKG
jgi:hypothetical protein